MTRRRVWIESRRRRHSATCTHPHPHTHTHGAAPPHARGFVQRAHDGIHRAARGDGDDEDDECAEKTIDDHVIGLAARASRVRRARVVECEWEWEWE